MKIKVIVPIITREFREMTEHEFRACARKDTEFSVSNIERGPASIESQFEVAVALPDILIQVKRAEEEGMDAIIIDCMMDPGVDAAREIASIPVIGMADTSFHLASMLAHKFSVITILDRDIPDLDRMFRKYDVASRVASVRTINVPVLDLRGNEAAVAKATTQAALLAVRQDGAAAIAFGCAGMAGVVNQVAETLKDEGYDIPVINPIPAAVKFAESLVDLNLMYSKVTYPFPPEKVIIYP